MRALMLATALLAFAIPARAGDIFLHNGSLMEVGIMESGQFVITYTQPRSGLADIGVLPGTLLVTGRLSGDRFSGLAHRFRRGCAPLSYSVTGFVKSSKDTFILSGAAAQFGHGCSLGGYDVTGLDPQSVLVFSFVAAATPKGVVSSPSAGSPMPSRNIPAGRPLVYY